MPRYEFRCAACSEGREVSASMAEADTLALVCLGCGGVMTKAVSRSVIALVRSGDRHGGVLPAAANPGRPSCADGAVHLSRPNPFREQIRSAGPSAQGDST